MEWKRANGAIDMKKENILQLRDNEKLQMIVDIKAELNYRELTNFLELPYLRGNAKDKQLKELSKICNVEKVKTKYRITEIYDSYLKVTDGRSVTLPNIEYILMAHLSQANFDGILFVSNKELLRLCYMINNNYYAILNNKDINATYIGQKYEFDDSFVEYVDKAYDVLKPSVINALKSMANKKEIAVTTGYKVVKGKYNIVCASVTDELGEELFKIQGEAMDRVGVRKYSDFWGRYANKRNDYYDLCNHIVKDKSKNDPNWIAHGWDFDKFYQCYAITLNTKKMKFDLQDVVDARQELNGITRDKLHNTKLLRNLSYNDIDKWFTVCNTNQGDSQYRLVDDIKERFLHQKS